MPDSTTPDDDTHVWHRKTTRPSYLLIEDTPADAHLLIRVLERFPGPPPQVTLVSSVSQAIATLERDRFAVVISDLDLPDSRGIATVQAVVRAAQGMPVVVLTGSHDEELGQQAVAVGAQDYLVKGHFQIPELRRVLRHAQERQRLLVALDAARQDAEASLERLTQLEGMRQQLVHMIVHDLRSPLFGMQIHLEAMESGLEAAPRAGDPQDLRQDLRKVLDMNAALVEMVSTILDVHRIDSTESPLHLGAHDVAALAQEAADHIGATVRGRRLQLQVPRCALSCDATLVRRLFANLMSNALRFSPPQQPVVVDGEVQGPWVECRVTDRGPGIPLEAQGRIFERFGGLDPSAKGYSTGLGLPFCKMVAERHQGSIGVRSTPGKGTTLWFRLPVAAAAREG